MNPVRALGSRLFGLLNRVIPKRNRVVLFAGDHRDDNCLAIYQSLIEHDYDGPIVWLYARDPHPNFEALVRRDNQGTRLLRKNSVSGVYILLSSRFIFQTYAIFGGITPGRNQVIVNLWHGMPIKAIGLELDPSAAPVPATLTIATSQRYRTVMAKVMGVDEASVLLSRQPREERMLKANSSAVRDRLGLPGAGIRSIFVWMPTYRQTRWGIDRVDGIEVGNVFELPDIDVHALEDFLIEENCVLFVRPHPMSTTTTENLNDSERIRYLDDAALDRLDISLYELLSATDVLITDVSSVFISYLPLDRPMIFCFPDLDAYRASRPLLIEPFEDWMPGAHVATFGELIAAMTSALGPHDRWGTKRAAARAELNSIANADAALDILTNAGVPIRTGHY